MLKSLKSKFGSKKNQNPVSGVTNSGHGNAYSPVSNKVPITQQPASNPFLNVPDAAPPAYTAAPNSAPIPQPQTAMPRAVVASTGTDDAYAFLSTFDTVFLIDDSLSMNATNKVTRKTRWAETAEALASVTPICTAHDSDGVDIYFINTLHRPFHKNVTSAGTIQEIFQATRPHSNTMIAKRLDSIIKPYLRDYEKNPEDTKPLNLICITDGIPTDDLDSSLIRIAKQLDKLEAPSYQVGVQFFQVGDDKEAHDYLESLDDELASIAGKDDLRDIVDTVPYKIDGGAQLTGDGILKVVLGAVNRRLDRKKTDGLHQ